MTSFTFSIEQLKSAPPEVRRWVENEVLAAIGAVCRVEAGAPQLHDSELAACTREEALQVFELIKGNFLLTQVFFELVREASEPKTALHTLDVAAMLRHVRLTDAAQLSNCLMAINQAFQQVRGDLEAELFGYDRYGRLYVHEETHLSVRRLWEQFMTVEVPRPSARAASQGGAELPIRGPVEPLASAR